MLQTSTSQIITRTEAKNKNELKLINHNCQTHLLIHWLRCVAKLVTDSSVKHLQNALKSLLPLA